MNVTVSISKCNRELKLIEEGYQGTLTSLLEALSKIKSTTNEFLTELVNEEKKNTTSSDKSSTAVSNVSGDKDTVAEQSDVEIDEDFIDSEIKKELSLHLSSLDSETTVMSEKRTKNQRKQTKRVRR